MAFKFLGVSPLSEFEWIKRQKKEGVLISYAQYLAGHFRGALLEKAELEQNGIHYFHQEGNPFMVDWKTIQKMLRVSAGETK